MWILKNARDERTEPSLSRPEGNTTSLPFQGKENELPLKREANFTRLLSARSKSVGKRVDASPFQSCFLLWLLQSYEDNSAHISWGKIRHLLGELIRLTENYSCLITFCNSEFITYVWFTKGVLNFKSKIIHNAHENFYDLSNFAFRNIKAEPN